MSQFIVGLTGGIGSGKTTVSNLFAEHGIDIIDADILAREVVQPGSAGLQAISTRYGEKVLLDDGSLDRRQLRNIVFSHSEEKHWLDNLLHPRIRELMRNRAQQASSTYALLVIPLLLENNLSNLVNRIVVVDIDETLQQQRTVSRDNVSIEQVNQIMANQASREQRLAHADDVINNNGSIDELAQQVEKRHHQYLNLAIISAKA